MKNNESLRIHENSMKPIKIPWHANDECHATQSLLIEMKALYFDSIFTPPNSHHWISLWYHQAKDLDLNWGHQEDEVANGVTLPTIHHWLGELGTRDTC